MVKLNAVFLNLQEFLFVILLQIILMEHSNTQTITIGGGCFWCVESVFQKLKGVSNVESGYSGGHVEHPTYKQVCGKQTGHVEVLRFDYNPSEISLEQLLDVFWAVHNPTTLDRQGNDVGPQYRSVIFYHNDEQKRIADESKEKVAPQYWDDPIVTVISPLINYYPAEEYHQNYFNRNPSHGYCNAVINPKLAKLRSKFSHLLQSTVHEKS